jgi:TATA-box binding protein (TBP) (component of TFIID and TFIIIB)
MSFIANVVSTAELGCQLDLHRIAQTVWNVMYNPKKFPSLILKIRKPAIATALVFKNGRLVCAGQKV